MRSLVRPMAAKFSGLYFSHFIFLGVLLPFFSGWLALRGFSASEIGMINGIALIMRLVCGPVVALLADHQSDKRRALLMISVLFAAAAASLNIVNAQMFIAIASVLIIWCFGLIVPLTDSMVLRADRNGLLAFGPVRAVGSVAFLISTIVGGFFLRQYGFGGVAPVLGVCALVVVAVTLIIPALPDPAALQRKPKETTDGAAFMRNAGQLIVHPIFILAILAAGMTQGAHAVYYAYSVLHWTAIGYSPAVIGWLWAIGVIAEIFLLMQARPLARRLGAPALMMVGGAAAAIRWMLTAFEPSLPLLFIVQMFHALTFGAAYLGAVEFIDRAIPVRFVNTGMVLFSTTGVGAITGLATMVAGFVYQDGGARLAYLMMAGMGVVAILLSLMLRMSWNGEKIID